MCVFSMVVVDCMLLLLIFIYVYYCYYCYGLYDYWCSLYIFIDIMVSGFYWYFICVGMISIVIIYVIVKKVVYLFVIIVVFYWVFELFRL